MVLLKRHAAGNVAAMAPRKKLTIQLSDHPASRAAHPTEVNFSTPIDDYWSAEFHVAAQDGQVVITDLRIGPSVSGDVFNPPPAMPPGGLTARTLRSVRFSEVLEHARSTLAEIADSTGLAGDSGLSRETLDAPRRPGRRGRPDLFYAEYAAEYVAAVRRGSRRPVPDIAATHNETPAYVRDVLHAARTRGLLTHPPAKGRPGGVLTEKALAVLAVHRGNGRAA
jgi:hypothetical protein